MRLDTSKAMAQLTAVKTYDYRKLGWAMPIGLALSGKIKELTARIDRLPIPKRVGQKIWINI